MPQNNNNKQTHKIQLTKKPNECGEGEGKEDSWGQGFFQLSDFAVWRAWYPLRVQ